MTGGCGVLDQIGELHNDWRPCSRPHRRESSRLNDRTDASDDWLLLIASSLLNDLVVSGSQIAASGTLLSAPRNATATS